MLLPFNRQSFFFFILFKAWLWAGEGSIIRKEKGNSWLREVEEYLKCDFHMYAPLCYDSACVNPPKGTFKLASVC